MVENLPFTAGPQQNWWGQQQKQEQTKCFPRHPTADGGPQGSAVQETVGAESAEGVSIRRFYQFQVRFLL